MGSLGPFKSTDQILEKIYSQKTKEHAEKLNFIDKQINLKVVLCEKFLNNFGVDAGSDSSTISPKCLGVDFFDKTYNSQHIDSTVCPSPYLHEKVCGPKIAENAFIGSRGGSKSECIRLENAKSLHESLILKLHAEEAKLQAEIDFLNKSAQESLKTVDYSEIDETIEDVNLQCENLLLECVKSIKSNACCDTLKVRQRQLDSHRSRLKSFLENQEREVAETKLICSKMEILRDMMSLEDSALIELTEVATKIHGALRRYLDITADVNASPVFSQQSCLFPVTRSSLLLLLLLLLLQITARFQSTTKDDGESLADAVDSEVKSLLSALPNGKTTSADSRKETDERSNSQLLAALDDLIASCESRTCTSLTAAKDFSQVVHDILDLLKKALGWLECPEGRENRAPSSPSSSSSCSYWNALSTFAGVVPKNLADVFFQVRRELDEANLAIQQLEFSYGLNQDS